MDGRTPAVLPMRSSSANVGSTGTRRKAQLAPVKSSLASSRLASPSGSFCALCVKKKKSQLLPRSLRALPVQAKHPKEKVFRKNSLHYIGGIRARVSHTMFDLPNITDNRSRSLICEL